MADCIEIEDLSVDTIIQVLRVKDLTEDNTSISNAEKAKKPYKVDTHKITHDMHYDLFFNEKTEGKSAFSRIFSVTGNSGFLKKIFGATANTGKNHPLFKDLYVKNATPEQKKEIGQRMQIRGLAMKSMIETVKSDADVQNNLSVPEEDIDKLFSGGSRNVATISMATALGRDIAYTMGFKMSTDEKIANRIYNKIGTEALLEVQDNTGILTVEEGGFILNNKIMEDKYTNHQKSKHILPGFRTVRINYANILPDLKDKEANENQAQRVNDAFESGRSVELMSKDEKKALGEIGLIDGAARYIERLSVPSNLAVPTEANMGVMNDGSTGLIHTEKMNKLLKDIQDTPGEVNPRVGKFFLHLNRLVEEAKKETLNTDVEYDFETIIKAATGKDKDLLSFIFGTFDNKTGVDTKGKAIGQSLSKTSTIQNIVEDATRYFEKDGTAKPIFFEHEMYRTGRVGYVQSILNPQTDKFFSRFILDGGVYTINTGKDNKEYIQLLNGIKDDSGMHMTEILKVGVNKDLDLLLDMYNDTYNSGLDGQVLHNAENRLFKLMNAGTYIKDKTTYNMPKLKGSLWQKMSSLEAINDVRQGTNNKITTRFQTKPDATGSGLILQLLQMVGFSKSSDGAIDNLKRLGVIKGAKEEDLLDDVYGFLEEAIDDSSKKEQTLEENEANLFIENMVDNKFVKNIREIAKPVTMIVSYLAGEATVKSDTGKAYTDAIFDVLQGRNATKSQLDFIVKTITDADEKYDTDIIGEIKKNSVRSVTAGSILRTSGVKNSLERYIADTTGEHMYRLIGKALVNGPMKDFQKGFTDLYKQMKQMSAEQDRLIATGKGTIKDSFQLKVLPVQIVMELADEKKSKEKNKSFYDKSGKRMSDWDILQKFGMMITSPSQVLDKVMGEDTLVMQESMNAITSLVNVIHSQDAAVMFRAHEKTREHMKNHYSASIHDANNANAIYNAVFQDMYREALQEVFANYNMYEQMVNSYTMMLDNRLPDNDVSMDADIIKKMQDNIKEANIIKSELVGSGDLDLKSERIFGFKDELDYDGTPEPSPESKKKPESDLKTEEQIEEVVPPTVVEKALNTINESKNKILQEFSKLPNIDKLIKEGKEWAYTTSDNMIHVVDKEFDGLTYEESLAHEITHLSTVAYLNHQKTRNTNSIKYAKKALDIIATPKFREELVNLFEEKDNISNLNQKLYQQAESRFEYILNQKTEQEKLLEFVAIAVSEPATAQMMYQIIDKVQGGSLSANLIKAINQIINDVFKYIKAATGKELKALEDTGIIDVQVLGNAINNINKSGISFNKNKPKAAERSRKNAPVSFGAGKTVVSPERKAFMKKIHYTPYTPVDPESNKIKYVEDVAPLINNWTSSMIASVIIDDSHKFKGQKQFEAADKYLTENFPIYSANRATLVDYFGSPFMQRMRGFLNPEVFGNRLDMERMIAEQDKATQERNSIDNNLIFEMKQLMMTLSPDDVADVYDIVSQAPMFNLTDDGTFKDIVLGNKDLDETINTLNNKLDRKDSRKAERMALMLSGSEVELEMGDAYNSDTAGPAGDRKALFEKVVALKTIRKAPGYKNGLKILKENTELYNLIIDASVGLKNKSDLLYKRKHKGKDINKEFTDAKRYRENLVMDIYKEEVDMEAITSKEYNEGRYSTDDGWEILRQPKGNEYGIAYRKSKDETYQQGAGTSTSYKHTDVIIPKSKEIPHPKNVLSTDVGQNDKRYKMVLTRKEKDKLGLIRNPADAIYRAYSRLIEIEQTQQVRDLLLTAEFTHKSHTEQALKAFDDDLKNMPIAERKWLIGLPDGVQRSDVMETDEKGKYRYPNIKKYYKVPERSTSVGNFRHNFDLVRIDAEPWLTGFKDAVLFENSPGPRKIAYTVRQLVKWTKITWTALSPVKIMNDAISNTLVLVGYDVPLAKIVSYGDDINKEIGQFEKLRLKELDARIHGKEDEAKKYKALVDDHPMAMILNNGLMQSINVELFQRDQSVVTGLQKDIEELLNKFVLLPDGKKSIIFNAIKTLQEKGDFGIESILGFLSKGAENVEALEALGNQLESSKEKFASLRESEKDEAIAKYLTEFLMTPKSEAVQLGSTLVQRADIIARGVLVRHMLDEGKTEEEAVIAATDAFINYKQNMPKELKILSDYGVLLFPSFWMRVQRVIWSLLKRNPATAIAALSMEEMIQMNITTVFDANLASKYEQGMFGLPPVMGFWQ